MNQLVGEKLSIVSSKAQTTRHRILGIVNEEDYQIVFSDTPGVVNAAYKLHENMMEYVNASISDADVLLFMTDTFENEMNHKETLERIQRLKVPVLCLINKIDNSDQTKVMERVVYWQEKLPNAKVYAVSALHKFNIEAVWEEILALIPESPPYYDKEEISDRPMRFFISEIIREKIFMLLDEEVPYSCEVGVVQYEERENLTFIDAEIHVERDSQKGILVGKQGSMIKKIGQMARKDIEEFLDQKVYLELRVRVAENWKDSTLRLRSFGYENQ